ncbi:alpha-galactosidase [Paenibacillus harenae]|uniref:Alpha-galactosidase n=1 Tax=Paenibacillus harenae TaxID=306543 RepID=A0ABT9UAB6_PAEHA|nr:alpha-galactosidase [Paenibacillus harenae]
MSGNFGYELDLTKFSEAERAEVKKQVEMYKEIRFLVQKGDLFRLRSPFAGNETKKLWAKVSVKQPPPCHQVEGCLTLT